MSPQSSPDWEPPLRQGAHAGAPLQENRSFCRNSLLRHREELHPPLLLGQQAADRTQGWIRPARADPAYGQVHLAGVGIGAVSPPEAMGGNREPAAILRDLEDRQIDAFPVQLDL